VYKVIYLFLRGEDYSIDPAVMIEIVKEHNLPAQKTYYRLAHIHNGFANILLAARQVSNGAENK